MTSPERKFHAFTFYLTGRPIPKQDFEALKPNRSGQAIQLSTLATRAGLFVAIACASIVAIESWQLWREREIQLRETAVASQNLARSIGQHTIDTFKEADIALVGLVERVEQGGVNAASEPRMRAFLGECVRELPSLHGLLIIDEDGHRIAGSLDSPRGPQTRQARAYFRHHRDDPDRKPFIGPPIQSMITGEWILSISRRIDRADGRFGGVAIATIKMDYFREFYNSLEIGKAGAVFVATKSGLILTRRPFDSRYIGRDVSALPLFRNYLSKALAGTVVATSALDGVTRVNSYRSLISFPLIASAALSQDEALAEWKSDAWVHGTAIGLLAAGLGLIGFRLIRQIERRARAESELVNTRSDLQALNAALEELAMQDGLTGLANRRSFDLALSAELNRASRECGALSLVMFDVDSFKPFNDTYGHLAGDECLRAIGIVLASAKRRPGDCSARYGGEELALLLPGADEAGALEIAEGVRCAIEQLAIRHDGNASGVVTVSAGVATIRPMAPLRHPKELIEAADKALYRAKSSGRNRVVN